MPLRLGSLSPERVQARLDDWKNRFAGFLGITPYQVPESPIINAMVKEQCRKQKLDPEQTRLWAGEQSTYVSFLNIYKFGGELIDPDKGEVRCPHTGAGPG